jgi:hypothetical protein
LAEIQLDTTSTGGSPQRPGSVIKDLVLSISLVEHVVPALNVPIPMGGSLTADLRFRIRTSASRKWKLMAGKQGFKEIGDHKGSSFQMPRQTTPAMNLPGQSLIVRFRCSHFYREV